MLQIRKSQRKQSPIKMSISGVPGSGKTYSSLLMARGLASEWNKIVIIDTENKSADLYDALGEYNVIPIEAPFTPAKYIEALKLAESEGMEVAIIDSCTHVWKGQGGLLEYNNSLGGRYTDWAKTTPLYQQWLNTILQSPMNIICTLRKKVKHEISNERGKMKIIKKGLEDEIRDGFEYEVTVALTVEQNNMLDLSVVKDRTGLFKGKPDFIITEETGKMLKEWNNGGKQDLPTKEQTKTFKEQLKELKMSEKKWSEATKLDWKKLTEKEAGLWLRRHDLKIAKENKK